MLLLFIGMSAAQLENDCLQEEVSEKTIEQGADLELWAEGNRTDFEERKTILNDLKLKLITKKPI